MLHLSRLTNAIPLVSKGVVPFYKMLIWIKYAPWCLLKFVSKKPRKMATLFIFSFLKNQMEHFCQKQQ